jgi:hypothetical protein
MAEQDGIPPSVQAGLDAINTRLAAIDKATTLQHDDLVRVPTQVDKAVGALRELLEQTMKTYAAQVTGELHQHIAETREKFIGVGSQFSERDTRTDQRAGDTKLAVDAAFAAAKEATAKIETGFTKQIDGMSLIIDTKTANLAQGISDLKDRVTASENRIGGADFQRKDSRDHLGLIVAGIAVVLALALHFIKT